MAKKAMIEREKKRARLVEKYAAKRAELKEIANDESRPMEERFKARLKLAKLPNHKALNILSSITRVNRTYINLSLNYLRKFFSRHRKVRGKTYGEEKGN